MEEFKVVGARDYVSWVTKGKVYESKNGVITFDNGVKSVRYHCVEDFLNLDNAFENPLFKEYKEQEEKQQIGRTPLKKRLEEIESRLSALEDQDRQENQNKSYDVEQLSKANSNLVRQNESLICKIHDLEKENDELRKLKCSKVMPEEVVFNLDLANSSFDVTNIAGDHLMSYEVLLCRNVNENGKLTKQTFYLKMIKEDK